MVGWVLCLAMGLMRIAALQTLLLGLAWSERYEQEMGRRRASGWVTAEAIENDVGAPPKPQSLDTDERVLIIL